MPTTIFWFRRDLRLNDNAGLYHALKEKASVQPIFIFDQDILGALKDKRDARVDFIHQSVEALKESLAKKGSDLWVFHGKPQEVFKKLLSENEINSVFTNHDYEPSAKERDEKIAKLCAAKKISFQTFKDQVIFEKGEVVTDAQNPYTVYTPYKNKWLSQISSFYLKSYPTDLYFSNLAKTKKPSQLISLKDIGFEKSKIDFPENILQHQTLKNYTKLRDFPAQDATSHLGLHLRFGTLSIRELAREAAKKKDEGSQTWLSELIWREFFMQILFHFPYVEKNSFRPEYDKINWRENKSEFERWCEGKTGYPLVDAGMRELNETGYMHNRVRMVTASFLCKHLLMHWFSGERYFASKLLDYDLAANNGNWQWAAGSGCDAAPYFRIFNPEAQAERFDPQSEYIKKWVPEIGTAKYPKPIIEHKIARERALNEFAKGLKAKGTKK